jgi:DNA invertase Pin-like site-specific DNA recombinase
MIRERVNAGLARARSQGKTLGRPKVDQTIEAEILALRQTGVGQLKIAKTLRVGTGTVQRVLREAA